MMLKSGIARLFSRDGTSSNQREFRSPLSLSCLPLFFRKNGVAPSNPPSSYRPFSMLNPLLGALLKLLESVDVVVRVSVRRSVLALLESVRVDASEYVPE